MKKILFLGAMAAMLLGTASCSNEVDQPAMGDEVNAAFRVSLDGIESRTISDGLTVNELYFEVYEAKTQGEGESATTTYTKLQSLSQKVAVANKTATVTTKLIKGKTYKFAFWAQKDGAYVATDLQNIQMNYANANANDENRDAFFANVEKTVTATFEEPVTLYRPFAQINFGASDVDALMDISGFESQLVVKNVPNQFNVLSGVASGEEAEVTLAATAVPARIPETLKVDGKDYTYISMNYILATPEKTTKDITLTVKDGDTEVKKLPVAACPMQRNYRTNILGDILSVEGKFNITIDQNFDTPDYVNVFSVKNAEEFMNALNIINNSPVGGVIKIDGNVDLSNEADKINISNKLHLILNERLTTQKGNQVCIVPGGDVTVEGEGTYETNRGLFQVLGGKVTVESGNFKTQNHTKGSGIYSDGSKGYGSEITINGGNFDCAFYGVWNNDPYGKTVINGGVIKSSAMKSYGTWAYCVRNCGTLIVNNGWIDGIHGGIAIDYGHLEINGGYITTHDYYEDGVAKQQNFYALYLGDSYVDYTDDVVINGGYFYVEPTQNYPCIYDKQGIGIEINGGYFNNLGRNNFMAGLGVTALDEPIQDTEHNATYSYKK